MSLSNEELERYSRHLILKEIGYRGQKRLAESKVLIIGAGGLGAPAAMYYHQYQEVLADGNELQKVGQDGTHGQRGRIRRGMA